ncbi:MAG: hypothetical protein JXR68_11700 [Bacteroidales bacterium]|nr:hypothetical protein [Bacteroidales bacterium]
MEIYNTKIKSVWFKAAVLGSIWASFEIVFGSFLHNIRFPMSGTILTILAVIIIITFSQIWKENGIVIRAGIIAALMKSISPSAVLIGPMTGIFMEALLIEFSFFVLGKNWLGYILGGILALYSVMIHKIITLLILYGGDIVKISENLYYFIIKQLKITDINFTQGILILSSFYVIVGFISAILGIYIGQKSVKNSKKEELENSVFKNNFLEENKSEKYSAFFLLFNLFSLVVVFVSLNIFDLLFSALISIFYIVFAIIKYKKAFRHLKKVGFWIQILLLLLISILFYSGTQNLSLLNTEGLIIGLQMILRMFVLLIGFSVISYELRNPLVRAILFRRGFGNLYQSMGLAFSVLPVIIDRNTNPKFFFKNPSKVITGMINIADSVYENFMNRVKNRELIVITGEKNKGKTTFVSKVIDNLKDKNILVQGFTAIGVFENETKSEFYLHDISTGEQKILCSIKNIGKTITGRFFFNDDTVEWGEEILKSVKNNKNTVVIVDEVGPLELKNKGWSNSIDELFKKTDVKIIWVVRKGLVKPVLRKFAVSKASIFDIETSTNEHVVEKLLEQLD